jgi:hypothetical protein
MSIELLLQAVRDLRSSERSSAALRRSLWTGNMNDVHYTAFGLRRDLIAT